LDQLTDVTYPDGTTEQFTYDEMGNRTSIFENGVITNYSANNLDQYALVGEGTYQYDKNGNLIIKNENGVTTRFFYDFENRLTGIQLPTDTIEYTYNPFGFRYTQNTNGELSKFLWDGSAVALEENNNNQTIARFTWGRSIDEAICMERNNSTYFYTQDGLLSTTDIFNLEGFPIEHCSYKAFGKPLSISKIGNPWYFTGLSYDFKSELQYNRFRFYSPNCGRFLNIDPAGFVGGLNLYAYVFNNPSNSTDPFGLYSFIDEGWEIFKWWQEHLIDLKNSRNPEKTRYWNAWYNEWQWGPSFDSYDEKYAWDKDGKLWRNPNYLPPNSPARPENWPTPNKYIPPEDWHSWMPYNGGICPTFIQLSPDDWTFSNSLLCTGQKSSVSDSEWFC